LEILGTRHRFGFQSARLSLLFFSVAHFKRATICIFLLEHIEVPTYPSAEDNTGLFIFLLCKNADDIQRQRCSCNFQFVFTYLHCHPRIPTQVTNRIRRQLTPSPSLRVDFSPSFEVISLQHVPVMQTKPLVAVHPEP